MSRSVHVNNTKICYTFFSNDILTLTNRFLLLSLYIFLTVSIITTNVWMMVSLWQNNVRFQVWQKLLVLLCLIDLCTGCMTIPIQIFMIFRGSEATCIQLAVQAFANALTPMMSCVMMTLIAAVRSFNITKNKTVEKLFSTKFIILLLVIATVLSISVALWHAINTQSYDFSLQGYFYVIVGLLLLIFLITSLLLNILLLKYIRKISSDKHLKKTKQSQQQVSITILIMSFASTLAYFPSGIVWLVAGTILIKTNKDLLYVRYIIPWLHALSVSNAAVNSLIYLVRTRHKVVNVYRQRAKSVNVNSK